MALTAKAGILHVYTEEGSSGVSERAWDNIPTLLPEVLNQDSYWLLAHLQQTSGVSSLCPVKRGKVY